MTIHFYLEARPVNQGRQVQLNIYSGQHQDKASRVGLGSATFSTDDWVAFRVIIIGGMRMAAFSHIAVDFFDGTRRDPPPQGGPTHIVQ